MILLEIQKEQFRRRLIYDQSELITNEANYKEAIQRQGLDLMTTRIWWDK